MVNVYDATGKLVQTLFNEYALKGNYSVDFKGEGISSGIYFYELRSAGFSETKKMLMVK